MTETKSTAAKTTTTDTLLKAIVNLDENQLRSVDDEGSFGTAGDIADGGRSQQYPQQQQIDGNELSTSPLDCNSNGHVANVNVNFNNRRTRLKNAIVSKWKTHRSLSTKRQSEEQQQRQTQFDDEDEDMEASYVALDDTATTTTTTISSVVSSALSSLKMKGVHSFQKAKSILTPPDNNDDDDRPSPTASHSTLQPKLSTELFHWYIHRSWKKKLLTVLVVTSSAFVLYDLFTGGNEGKVDTFLGRFLDWMNRHPVWGVYAYIGVLALASLIFIPPSPLIFSSGFIFRSIYGPISGPLVALLSSYIGAVIGGSIGFLRANYMTRDLIRILMRRYPLLRAIDAAVVRNSLRVMILLRLNPLIPFGVLNYLFGISGVSGPAFVLGVVGVVPWHLWLVCLGAGASGLVYDGREEENSVGKVVLLGMGSAFGVIGLVITWKFAKKELQKEVNTQAVNDFRIQDPNQAPQVSTRRNGNEIEEADLEFADYLKMQLWGINVDEDVEVEEEDYRLKLDWVERLLDDFS